MQHGSPKAAPWLEKRLVVAEVGGNQQQRNFLLIDFMEKMEPVFIFHPNHQLGIPISQYLFCIGGRINREVADMVGTQIIFADFVAAGRKKAENEAMSRELLPKGFKNRPPLFKLAQTRAVHPNAGWMAPC